jgi:hypothetical protein
LQLRQALSGLLSFPLFFYKTVFMGGIFKKSTLVEMSGGVVAHAGVRSNGEQKP